MAETTLLKAEERNETGKSLARAIRKNGQIPCIIYGDKKEPLAASLNAIETLKLYNSGKMLSQLIDVETSKVKNLKQSQKMFNYTQLKEILSMWTFFVLVLMLEFLLRFL